MTTEQLDTSRASEVNLPAKRLRDALAHGFQFGVLALPEAGKKQPKIDRECPPPQVAPPGDWDFLTSSLIASVQVDT